MVVLKFFELVWSRYILSIEFVVHLDCRTFEQLWIVIFRDDFHLKLEGVLVVLLENVGDNRVVKKKLGVVLSVNSLCELSACDG
jgi:hypothetical protein